MSEAAPGSSPGSGFNLPSRSRVDSGSGIHLGARLSMLLWLVGGTVVGVILGLLFIGVGFEFQSGQLGGRHYLFTGKLWGTEVLFKEVSDIPQGSFEELKRRHQQTWTGWMRRGSALVGGLFGLITASGLCLRSGLARLQTRLDAWERLQGQKDPG
jgi:hypothetical protein